ncbi:MAG: hypothetical protein AUI14_00015 [Actinobacteria bacterium 13_2_20CM_2_71_6]|nr:MAG: hypothetical protein AUI14_00015 [Actinobacteria bacterium 13_2_20CM_2_71_6]
MTTAQVRRYGVAVTAGTLVWVGGLLTVGANPATSDGITIGDLTGLAFQLGLFALLRVQLRTRATSRVSVAMLYVESVLLALATTWSVLHAAVPAWRDAPWLAVLDACWPLSMLGMFVIGLKVALAGRWRGLARIWPLVAETWVVVTIASMILFGRGVGEWVGIAHLLVGYTGLGIVLAWRPHLTDTGS